MRFQRTERCGQYLWFRSFAVNADDVVPNVDASCQVREVVRPYTLLKVARRHTRRPLAPFAGHRLADIEAELSVAQLGDARVVEAHEALHYDAADPGSRCVADLASQQPKERVVVDGLGAVPVAAQLRVDSAHVEEPILMKSHDLRADALLDGR